MLFEAHFIKLANDQFLIALAWEIAALQDADDPRRVLKRRAIEQGQPRINVDSDSLCSALLSCYQLLIGMV